MLTFQTSHQIPFLPSGESALEKLIATAKSPTGQRMNVDEIKNIVTAEHLCSCRDPITTAFKVRPIIIGSMRNDDGDPEDNT